MVGGRGILVIAVVGALAVWGGVLGGRALVAPGDAVRIPGISVGLCDSHGTPHDAWVLVNVDNEGDHDATVVSAQYQAVGFEVAGAVSLAALRGGSAGVLADPATEMTRSWSARSALEGTVLVAHARQVLAVHVRWQDAPEPASLSVALRYESEPGFARTTTATTVLEADSDSCPAP